MTRHPFIAALHSVATAASWLMIAPIPAAFRARDVLSPAPWVDPVSVRHRCWIGMLQLKIEKYRRKR